MKQAESKKIAVASPNPNAYSESFIKAHVDRLPATIFLSSGYLPNKVGNKMILNRYKVHINNFLMPVLKRNFFSPEKALAKILKKHRIGAVLAEFGPCGCAVLPACKKTKIPLFVHFHGFDASDTKTLEIYSNKYRNLFNEAEAIFVVSTKMKEKLLELGCLENKLILNCYGPDEVFFQSEPAVNSNTFFGVGRFVEKKAPYLVVLAFRTVLNKHPEAKLIIGGDGTLLPVCENIVRSLGMQDNVHFPGVLTREDIFRYMGQSLAFVQHSIVAASGDSEGTPVAILEASAAALPVVSTNHAGIPDVIINGTTGILVDELDIEAMAEAMVLLIENKDLAKKMGLAGRKRITNYFTMDRHIDMILSTINKQSRSSG